MSFVYIDSQDREVNIPSVDAVRLRIELGAIKDQTRFFDSNTGKWAPASEHEIYRTLKRQLMEVEQGFVAPPPPSVGPGGSAPPEGLAPEVEASKTEAVAVEVDDSDDSEEPADANEAEATRSGVQEVDSQESREHQVIEELEGFGDLELVPVDESDEDGASTETEAETNAEVGEDDDLWSGVVPDRGAKHGLAEGGNGPEATAEADPSDTVDPSDAEGVVAAEEDRGDGEKNDAEKNDAGEDAAEEFAAGEVRAAAGESFVTSAEDELMSGLDPQGSPSTLDDESIKLEPSLADSFNGAEAMGSQDFGEPHGDYGESDPDTGLAASWAQGQEAVGEEAVEEASPPGSEADAFDSVWDSPDDHRRPEPDVEADEASPDPDPFVEAIGAEEELAGAREGSAPPQRKLTKARTPGAERIAGMVALVVVLGAAVFFGWRFLAPALGGPGSGGSAVVMPPLDQELVPRMRQLAGRASERMTEDMLALPERAVVPDEPSEDWLAGIYLARASGYPNVPEYWSAVREWVQVSQISENALFREALRAQLDTANLAASDAEAIRDRALAGFQAAGSDRLIVYNQMLEVAERSIELHQFLLANEDQVTYEPAGSGVSRDPVLEAVPATETLGDDMWERVALITNAMDALGYLDRIDTERIIGVFLEKLEATAIH